MAAVIHGSSEALIGAGPARDRPDRRRALFVHPRDRRAACTQNATGAIENACLDIKGKALGVPVYELFGGAVRDRIPVYWSRCGVIRARCADMFDGKVIDRPAVRTLDDLVAAAREARDLGYKAIKTNLLRVRRQGRPPVHAGLLGAGPAIRSSNLPDDMLDALIDAACALRDGAGPGVRLCMRSQFQLQARRLSPHRQGGRAVRPDVARNGHATSPRRSP